MPVTAGTPYYFATWTGYTPPVQPRGPIDYADAEASRAFSVFVFDEHGRVASFEKWLATTTPREPFPRDTADLRPGTSYFACGINGSGAPGRQLSLEETHDANEYYRVRVRPDGEIGEVEHVRRQRTIRHDYAYWENGSLREFRFQPGSGAGGVEHYDRQGNRVGTP